MPPRFHFECKGIPHSVLRNGILFQSLQQLLLQQQEQQQQQLKSDIQKLNEYLSHFMNVGLLKCNHALEDLEFDNDAFQIYLKKKSTTKKGKLLWLHQFYKIYQELQQQGSQEGSQQQQQQQQQLNDNNVKDRSNHNNKADYDDYDRQLRRARYRKMREDGSNEQWQ